MMVMSSRQRERETGESGQPGGAGAGHNGKGLEVRTGRNHQDELIVEEFK